MLNGGSNNIEGKNTFEYINSLAAFPKHKPLSRPTETEKLTGRYEL
jgi:hypothetical protein